MSALLNIAVAEPSAIIRSGLEAVLKRIPGFRIQIIEIATAELLQETLRSHKPDILIINPSLPGYYTIQLLKEETGCTEMKCIALLYAVADHALLRPYDDQINIYDSPDEIRHKLERLHGARVGHNPSTQKEIKIPASKAPAFRVSKQLKEKVNVVKAKKAKK